MGYFIWNNSKKELNNKVQDMKAIIDNDKDDLVTKEELLEYFNKLADKIDSNKDGIITQNELKVYVKSQMNNKDNQIIEIEKLYEIEKLKSIKLEEEVERLKAYLDFATGEDTIRRSSFISSDCLMKYIEDNIMKTNSNHKYIPDSLEKKAYFNLYKTSLESVKQLCNTSSLEILNHKLTFIIQPNH